MAETALKKVGLLVSPGLHKEAKKRAAAEGTSFQQVLFPTFEAWALGNEIGTPPTRIPATPATGKTALVIQKLEAILNAKEDPFGQREFILSQIDIGYERIAPKGAKAKKVS